MMRRAEIAQASMGFLPETFQERGQQPRFANARLSRHQHDLSLAALRSLPAPDEKIELLLAADQRHFTGPQGLEATLDRALPHNPPGGYGFGEALYGDRSQVLALVESG